MIIALALIAACTAATALCTASVFRVTGARRRAATAARARAAGGPEEVPVPVSVLKPLCGADDALEANLATFFAQRYPVYEIVFGVEGEADPAAAVVRRLRARHPEVPCRLVVHDGRRGLNPKVSNLRAMLGAVANDVVVVSDSNVAVSADYLAHMVAELTAPDARVGLVTNLVAGAGERTLGATLENLHLCGAIAGPVAASQEVARRAVVVGKSMMFRRSVFERLGGLESVASLLAEDYVIGRMFQEAGFAVRVSGEVVRNVCASTSPVAFVRRQLRWSVLRSRLAPAAYALEPLTSPAAVAIAALAALAAEQIAGRGAPGVAPLTAALVLAWGVGLTMLRDGTQWWRLRGPRGLAAALALGPLKDVALVAVWAAAPFVRHVSWRGARLRVAAGTRLYTAAPVEAPCAPRVE
ncbi:MAG TPA: glycosyltransferase [Myxococcota bacterium]|nr:glycosyltransferase [Myxococcota bacterium]